MSSISSVSHQFTSPLQLLKNELSSEVSSGVVASGDQDALSSALDAIDEAMQSEAKSDRGSGTRPSPSDMQEKLESLISAQVDSGQLTESQANELKGVFANAMPEPGGGGGPGGAGGPGGPGGPGGAPPPNDSDSDSDSSSTDSTETSVQKLLEEFLKTLQASLDKSSASYGADGRSSSVSAALLIDYQS
jgi:hypothetical protein